MHRNVKPVKQITQETMEYWNQPTIFQTVELQQQSSACNWLYTYCEGIWRLEHDFGTRGTPNLLEKKVLWLGTCFMNSATEGDPDVAIHTPVMENTQLVIFHLLAVQHPKVQCIFSGHRLATVALRRPSGGKPWYLIRASNDKVARSLKAVRWQPQIDVAQKTRPSNFWSSS